ncbi:MAG: hypothetical protein V9H26_15900 [Verrucomicrobiota bacterium]
MRLQGGKALWYRNRWIRSNAVSAALGEPPAPGERADRSRHRQHQRPGGMPDKHGRLSRRAAFPSASTKNSNTIAHDPFGGTLHYAFSAHPHLDPDSGEMHAICYEGNRA